MTKTINSLLTLFLFLATLPLQADLEAAPSPNPFIGTWILDVEKTKKNRENIQELPEGLTFKPKPEDVKPRTVTFDESSFFGSKTYSKNSERTLKIIKSNGSQFLLHYGASVKWGAELFCWWEFSTEDTAIGYCAVFQLDDPMLKQRMIKSFYNREKVPSPSDNIRKDNP